jgi:transcriptional regulator with XRE-family HTH domain
MNGLFAKSYQVPSEDLRAQLASNLRRLRIARHLSLSELARATAMSKATLSGIERGSANPTIGTLAVLAGALQVSTAELLQEAELGEVRIVRARQPKANSRDQPHALPLEALGLNGRIDFFELALPARHVYETPPQAARSRRHLFVLQGKLIAGPVDRVSELAAGDYASYPSDVPHVCEAIGVAVCMLVLDTFPD